MGWGMSRGSDVMLLTHTYGILSTKESRLHDRPSLADLAILNIGTICIVHKGGSGEDLSLKHLLAFLSVITI